MAGQYFSERELALLCLASVIPSEAENRAAGEAARWTGRAKAERVGSERIKSLDIAGRARLI
jgi:hypothetical protein